VSTQTEIRSPIRRLFDWDFSYLRNLANEFKTPLYVIDTDRIRANGQRLRDAFPAADIRYAMKANSSPQVRQTIRELGFSAECASAGEVHLALEAEFSGSKIHYTAVNPPDRDLDFIIDVWEDQPELTITVGARDTITRLAERGYSGRLCLRANPGVGAGHHKKVTTGSHPKFGIPTEDIPLVANEAASVGSVVGVHAHAGSGISGEDLSSHKELVSRMGELARTVEVNQDEFEFVNVGGGFGVPYHPEEEPLELETVAEETRSALGELKPTLAIEPGRYFVADAGVLITQVNTVKQTRETTVVGVGAGMTTLIRPAMYDAYHAVRNLNTDTDRENEEVMIAGPICESADVLAVDREIPLPQQGEYLAIGNAGAYGYEMSSNYNARPRPAEVTISDEDAVITRRRETLRDLTAMEFDHMSNTNQ